MRGKGQIGVNACDTQRITPAYAGKRVDISQPVGNSWDHPCVCGEKDSKVTYEVQMSGSPLRMRGKADPNAVPAPFTVDHPCICGEKVLMFLMMILIIGSPLHMRGKVLGHITMILI